MSYRRHKRLERQTGLLTAALMLAVCFGIYAVSWIPGAGELTALAVAAPSTLALILGVRALQRRQEARRLAQGQIAALGFASDIDGILEAPERLEVLRDAGRRIHVTRYVKMSAGEAGVSTQPVWICAVELAGGAIVDLESGPAASIEEGAERLARALAVPLVDFTYGPPVERRP